jgi:hypothetical protein
MYCVSHVICSTRINSPGFRKNFRKIWFITNKIKFITFLFKLSFMFVAILPYMSFLTIKIIFDSKIIFLILTMNFLFLVGSIFHSISFYYLIELPTMLNVIHPPSNILPLEFTCFSVHLCSINLYWCCNEFWID